MTRLFGKRLQTRNSTVRFDDVDDVQRWLTEEFADRLGISVDELDTGKPLAGYGLDSKTAISLAADLEKIIGQELSPTLAWDYPTIEALARYLNQVSASPGGSP